MNNVLASIRITDLDGKEFALDYTQGDRDDGVTYEEHMKFVNENRLSGDRVDVVIMPEL